MTLHHLEPGDETLHGDFSPERPPVLTVDPGDTVRLRTLDAFWSAGPWLGHDVRDRPRVPQHRDGVGHALIGPIAVRGASPGDVLEVRIDAVVPAAWGSTAQPRDAFVERHALGEHHGIHAWTLDVDTMTGTNQHGHTVALRPFLGVIGMPPAEPGRHSTGPPRRCGGNLDCRELVVGSTLLLPVPVPGALLSVGDGHAAQGDGEVVGTAIECPMDRVELTLDLRQGPSAEPLDGPVARTPAGWITMGLGDDLDTATHEALQAMIALLGRLHGVTRADALQLASVVVDLRVTQIVNGVVGVHAVLPPGAVR